MNQVLDLDEKVMQVMQEASKVWNIGSQSTRGKEIGINDFTTLINKK